MGEVLIAEIRAQQVARQRGDGQQSVTPLSRVVQNDFGISELAFLFFLALGQKDDLSLASWRRSEVDPRPYAAIVESFPGEFLGEIGDRALVVDRGHPDLLTHRVFRQNPLATCTGVRIFDASSIGAPGCVAATQSD